MATSAGLAQAPIQTKRKFTNSDGHDPNPKKPRVAGASHNPPPSPPPPPATDMLLSQSSLDPYHSFLARLKPRFEVKRMSVMPSTKTNSHITKALEHLSRFSVWDQSVLPGVVLLTAKSAASGKLISIAEIVRRRIGECEQKWYQYNVLSETEYDQPQQQHPAVIDDRSIVKDTYMAVDAGGADNEDDDEDDEYFETSVTAAGVAAAASATAAGPSIHEQAVNPFVVRHKHLMAVFISRVPLEELKAMRNIGFQSNEDHIEHLRKRRMGLVS